MAVRSVHHSSPELGRLERHERGPHPALAGIVNRYCGFDHRSAGISRRREVAQDQVTIILSFGPRMTISGPAHTARSYRSFIAALTDRYAVTEEYGELAGVQIDLSPLGAHQLFGVAMHELSSALVVPLEDVWGRESELLAERLAELAGWNARLR